MDENQKRQSQPDPEISGDIDSPREDGAVLAAEEPKFPEEALEEQESSLDDGLSSTTLELLELAKAAEEQAQTAAAAAATTGQIARRAIGESSPEGDSSKLKEAKMTLVKQAAATANAALQAQTDARDAAAAAVCKAEAETRLALDEQSNAEAEVKRIVSLVEKTEEEAESAKDSAYKAQLFAEEKALEVMAWKKALEAAEIIVEDNRKKYLESIELLNKAQGDAANATGRLNNILNQANAAKLVADELIVETEPPPAVKNPKKNIGKLIWFYAKLILIALLIAVVIRSYVIEVVHISGNSMNPYIEDGDSVVLNKVTYLVAQPQRGDVVVIDAPDRNQDFYVKRIVGLPNEVITINDGKVYIDGMLLYEPYLEGIYTNGDLNQMIETDSYFVLGDNRSESHDSRNSAVGAILEDSIKGKIVFRIYPWDGLGFLK